MYYEIISVQLYKNLKSTNSKYCCITYYILMKKLKLYFLQTLPIYSIYSIYYLFI